MKEKNKPKKAITIFLILSTMLTAVALFGCGIYSLYVSIGFRFLTRNVITGVNTSALYTYPNSIYGTGTGTMVGLIIISIVMLGLGIGMAVVFFKQLPLYRQIKLIRNLPTIKYKEYSKEAKKSIVVLSFIAYIICIGFSVFAIIVALQSGLAYNYLGFVVASYVLVLALSIISMVLMIIKVVQLSKIKQTLLQNEKEHERETNRNQNQEEPQSISYEKEVVVPAINTSQKTEDAEPIKKAEIVIEEKKDKLFTDGIFELGDQLQKLREMHISGLIDADEYILIREKWINAVLSEPLFGKKQSKKNIKVAKQKEDGQSKIIIN